MAEGQYQGKRGYYLYTSDVGEVYVIQTDQTLATVAGTGLIPATRQSVGNANRPPVRFKPRGVHWQGELGGRIVRKFIVCNSGTDNVLFSSGFSVGVTIDGVAGVTTGRRGESATYANLPAGAAPANGGGGGAIQPAQ